MCAVARCEVVGAGIEDIGAGGAIAIVVLHIIAGDVLQIDLNRNDLGCAGCQFAGLLKVQQLDRDLLQTALGIGSLTVDLHRGLAGNLAGVGYLHIEGSVGLRCAGLAVDVHADLRLTLDLLREGGIAQAVAKAVGHFVIVIPLGGRSVCTHGRGCIAHAVDAVRIAGLVVTVAGIQTLGLDGVSARGEAQQTAGTGDDVCGVGVVHLTHVLHRGSRHIVGGVDVGQTAGGAGAAAEDIGNADHAVAAGEADPQDRINIGIVLQIADLNGSCAIDQNDDLIAGLLCGLDDVTLVGGQSQRLVCAQALCDAAGQIILGLCAGTADDHDGRIAVLGKAGLIAAVHSCDLGQRRLARVIDLSGRLVVGVVVSLIQLLIDADHSGVDLVTCTLKLKLITTPRRHGTADCGLAGLAVGVHTGGNGVGKVRLVLAQSLLQIDEAAPCLDAEAGTDQRHMRADAQQSDLGAACQRQNIVLIFQQNGTLCRLLAVQVYCLLDEGVGVAGTVLVQDFGRRGKFIVERICIGALRDKLLALGSEVGVDGRLITFEGHACHDRQRENKGKQCSQTSQHHTFLSHAVLLFFFCIVLILPHQTAVFRF